MKTILLKFAGPLQSWGTKSHFETRHTDFYPSKSAIIGIVAACLGYRRNDDDKIQRLNDLDIAVRIDQQGLLHRDYHIAQKYKDNGEFDRTYVTNRYYLEDAIFVIAIGHENEPWLEEIVTGLKTPYFQPFMGRRSLPLTADFVLGVRNEGVIESLKTYPWQAADWYKRQNSGSLTVYADGKLLPGEVTSMRKDHVLSFSQKERKYAYRSEVRIEVVVTEERQDTEHDIFSVVGG